MITSKTIKRNLVILGPYNLFLADEMDSEVECCWVIENGDALMLSRLWHPEEDMYRWSLWIGCTEIPVVFCGASYEPDPQKAADAAWMLVEEIAAMYCEEDGWA